MKRNASLIYFTGRLLVGLLLLCGLASATTILVTGVDWNRGESIAIVEDGVPTEAYFAGVIFISLTQDGLQFNRDTLCVDLFTDIYLGQTYNTTVVSPDAVAGKNLNRVSWLIDNVLTPTQGPTDFSNLPQTDWVISAAQGAGLQLAIWDIVHDGGDGLSAGSVQAIIDPENPPNPDHPVTPYDWAVHYENVSSSGQSSNNAYIYNNVNMGNGQPAQMLAGPQFLDGGPAPLAPSFTASDDPSGAPEPATLVLVGAALIVIAKCLRKKARRPGQAG